MKAKLTSWQVNQVGPAFSTRREYPDGSVTYEAVHDVMLRFTVIGDDAREFLSTVRQLEKGAKIKGIEIEGEDKAKGRKYVFD